MSDPILDQLFIDQVNADLADQGCSAQIAFYDLSAPDGPPSGEQILALIDDEGAFVTELPTDAAPEMIALSYALYGRGLNHGVRLGEDAAWAKLRFLIGAGSA